MHCKCDLFSELITEVSLGDRAGAFLFLECFTGLIFVASRNMIRMRNPTYPLIPVFLSTW